MIFRTTQQQHVQAYIIKPTENKDLQIRLLIPVQFRVSLSRQGTILAVVTHEPGRPIYS